MKSQVKASTMKSQFLIKASTMKLMWATLNSNLHEFPSSHPHYSTVVRQNDVISMHTDEYDITYGKKKL